MKCTASIMLDGVTYRCALPIHDGQHDALRVAVGETKTENVLVRADGHPKVRVALKTVRW